MVINQSRFHPGFAIVTTLVLSACGGSGDRSASLTTAGPDLRSDLRNVYSSTEDESLPTDLENLLVFGDSYSNENRSTFRTWHEIVTIGTRQPTTTLETYAVSSASARNVGARQSQPGNTMKRQIDEWLDTDPTFSRGDATVAWFGYSDVDSLSDLSQSKQDHRGQIQRIIDAGALNGNRRLFVPMLHDWERNPAQQRDGVDKRDRVIEWNQHVADLANGNKQIIAVDLFTVFERVFNDPEDFNFTDVTNPHPEDRGFNDYTENLFVDSNHFGLHGHDIIAEVFNHYMTRGWQWANTLQAGAEAAAQLESDIDNGRIDRINKLNGEQRLGFSSFAIGEGRDRLLADFDDQRFVDPARSGLTALRLAGDADHGIALDYALAHDASIGVVISDYGESAESQLSQNTSDLDYDSRGVSVYAAGEAGGFHLRTLVSSTDDEHIKRDRNALATAGNKASFDGSTLRVAQTVSKPIRAGNAWLTPSANLSYSKQEVDGFTIGNAFVSDLEYSSAEASQIFAVLGLNAAFDPIHIKRDRSLTLTAGFNYNRSLHRDDYDVEITEAATGLSTKETIEQDAQETVALQLGARLDAGEALSLSSNYALTKQMGFEASQNLMFNLNYHF